jgi:hypothetical protein
VFTDGGCDGEVRKLQVDNKRHLKHSGFFRWRRAVLERLGQRNAERFVSAEAAIVGRQVSRAGWDPPDDQSPSIRPRDCATGSKTCKDTV